MTVESSLNRSGPFIASGTDEVFPRQFLLLDPAHMRVVRVRAGVESDITTGITHDGLGSPDGVVRLTGVIQAGDRITLLRNVPHVQRSDYSAQASVPTDQIERDFDLTAMQIQDLSERQSRALTLPPDSTSTGEDAMRAALAAPQYAAAAQSAASQVVAMNVQSLAALRLSTFVFAPGSIVTARAEGAALQVVPSGGDLVTAVGVHFRALPLGDGIDPRIFGLVAGASVGAVQIAKNDAALTAAFASGLPLRLVKGIYEINRVQLPAGDSAISGAGATIIKVGNARNMFDVPLGTAYATLRVRDLTLDGNCDAEAARDNASSIIYFGANSGRIDVSGCTIKNPRGRGIYVRSTGLVTAATVSVMDNFFTGGKEAQLDPANAANNRNTHYVQCCDVQDVDISHNRMSLGRVPVGPGLAGIVITTFDTTNSLIPSRCTIIGNTLENLGQAGSVPGGGALGAIDFYKGAGRAVIQGNRLTGGCGRQINVKCDTGMSIISGNIVHSMRDLGAMANIEMGPAIVVNGSVEDTGSVDGGFIISGNNIRDCPKEAIFCLGEALHGTNRATDYMVTGNIVSLCTVGVRVRNLRDCQITGNVISVCSSHGVDYAGVQRRITVRGNDIDCAGTGVTAFGAGVGTEDVVVQDNFIRGTPSIASAMAAGGILLDTCNGGLITGNDIRNTTGAAIKIATNINRVVVQNNKLGPNTTGFVQTVNAPAGSVIAQYNSEQS